MKQYINLTKRNCLVFLRDRSAVFFSVLAMLIVLMLNGVFLGSMNEENVLNLLTEYGGVRDTLADEANAKHLVRYWTLAGILVVNAVTVTLTVIGTMVDDTQDGKIICFYSAPVHRNLLAFSYITSAILIGMLFCSFTLVIALVYIVATGGKLLGVAALGKLFLLVLLIVSIFAVIMYLAALFVKSSGAWSGIATVVGTLVGFMGGIYIPVGALPEGVATVLKYLPFLHGTALVRNVCCKDILAKTFTNMPEQAVTEYKEAMGITLKMGDEWISSEIQILFLIGCGILAFIMAGVVQKKKEVNDR